LATVFRDGRTPVVIVMGNDGYTVERAIHGRPSRRNDISLGLDFRAGIHRRNGGHHSGHHQR
jgi:TPP-dependent 2-oxoacid decarboxylase